MKKYFILFSLALTIVFAVSYFVKIDTGLYFAESPIVRWKFAIYTGECNDETGCLYLKMKETGILEYFGVKKIPFIDKEFHSTNDNIDIADTLPKVKIDNDMTNNIHKDTLQYLMEGENEDNIYSLFLTKGLDTISIVLNDNQKLYNNSKNKMYFVEWHNQEMTSGGDSELKYQQAFMKNITEIKAKSFK